MKILLIQPNSSEHMVGFTSMVRPEPLALEIIASVVPEHEVRILDLRVDPVFEDTLSSFKPELVGLTGYTTDVPRIRQICQEVKSRLPATVTVVGGYHATLCPHDFNYNFIDVIVLGEGEVTFKELVSALENRQELSTVNGIIYRRGGQQVATKMRPMLPKLDGLPIPARHLTEHYRSHYHFHVWEDPTMVETARGCPYRCTFCAVWKFHHGMCRFKSPEAVLCELKTISSSTVCFADDNFLQNLRRAERIHELIEQAEIRKRYWMQARADTIVRHPHIIEKWAEIGLEAALIGFEKFREQELASVNKKTSVKTNEEAIKILQANGVDIWGGFIIDPQWTEADFDALIDYVRSLKICFPFFTVLTPLPGTQLFEEKFKELRTLNYEVFDFLHTVLPTKLPLPEFYCNMARLYANTTMGLHELKKRVKSGRISLSSLSRIREVLKDVTNPQAYLKST